MRQFLVAISGIFLFAANPLFAESPATGAAAQQFDNHAIEAAGIRTLTSKHLILCTDVPSSPEVDGLPELFDQAVPQWVEYFGVDPEKTEHWQARAYLIGDRRRFEALKLLPPGREDFVNGISMGAELWFHDQPTAYYRRHLLLHEGTHVFMASFLGGCGPGWYMEGIAELFGTHRLDEKTGKLTMRIMPQNREEVPMLGRIKLIRDAISDLTLPDVMQLDNRKQMNNESYAWCWAAAKLLDSHPRYRDRFRGLSKYVLDEDFNDKMRHDYDADWNNLLAEWLAFVTTLDHGYDFDRMAIDFDSHRPASGNAGTMPEIATDRGWQSTGIQFEAGKSYRVTAKGRYQIAVEEVAGKSQAWPCEPGGVTIEYHDGHPLGMLLGAINPAGELSPNAPMSFVHPIPIGLEATIKPATAGPLFLRVNNSAAKLEDNTGTLTAEIVPIVSP